MCSFNPQKTESPVKCTDNHQFAVLWDAVDTITTSNVILTSSDTEMSSFVIYKSSDHHLFYFLAGISYLIILECISPSHHHIFQSRQFLY